MVISYYANQVNFWFKHIPHLAIPILSVLFWAFPTISMPVVGMVNKSVHWPVFVSSLVLTCTASFGLRWWLEFRKPEINDDEESLIIIKKKDDNACPYNRASFYSKVCFYLKEDNSY